MSPFHAGSGLADGQRIGKLDRGAREALKRVLTDPRFEVVPIKGVDEQARHLPRGTLVTVTCSPTRGIERTLQVAERLTQQELRVVPHISARLVADRSHLRDILERLEALGLRHIFVVAGDVREPAGSFSSGLELLRAMADLGHRLEEIGIPAYPERHPFIDDATLRSALHEKQRYATYMVTQICFDAGQLGRWLSGVRQDNVHLPVYIGLPGVVDTRRLLQISVKIGVGDSIRFLSKHTGMAARLLGRGGYHPEQLLERLAPLFAVTEYGIAGIHLNTFNEIERTEQWRREMRLLLMSFDEGNR